MLRVLRVLTAAADAMMRAPRRLVRLLTHAIAFNPNLGPLRYLATAAIVYTAFAILLVYVVAPIRGITGGPAMRDKLGYDAERWLATAIYDPKGNFVGTFDARLDSLRDVNYTDSAIMVGDYTANPDHKSIPVKDVPEHYWKCLMFQEDRYLGGWLNPYGIDLFGVLKIPLTAVTRTIARKRPSLGAGGSTLPMQFARVIYKTPPSPSEDGLTKLRRKFGEWWLAPVIYNELTRGGDNTRLKQWAANHIWLAQRTGGQPLHGVEVTSRIVFGKEAKDLTIAEQFVLASAVNRPIMLLEGSDRINEVRLDQWRYLTEVRARTCAERLIEDDALKTRIVFELMSLAGGPPDPKVKPILQEALQRYVPEMAKRAQANPVTRANVLLASARYGVREEMKQRYGFAWRDYVRGVTTTFDITDNLAFREAIDKRLAETDSKWKSRLDPAFTLDPAKVTADKRMPNVVVAAADGAGNIVRYYESGETAPYFGSTPARSLQTGHYDASREGRMIASTGKALAAIAIANEGRDNADSLYLDTQAPERGLETCAKGGTGRYGRKAIVAFACSLNGPLLNRTAQIGQSRIRKLVDDFGFAMPPAASDGGTPPSTAVVLGQIAGAPRRVHHMSSVLLASLIGRGTASVPPPSLISAYDYTFKGESGGGVAAANPPAIVPRHVIRPGANALLKILLQAPLCYSAAGESQGTLKSLSNWCPARRGDIRLHFAKTGTQVGVDPNATVDAWITGGLQFSNGAAYSYVVLVGTGSAQDTWARSLHASQVAAPLLDTLLSDLTAHARSNPQPDLLPPRRRVPKTAPVADSTPARQTVSSFPATRLSQSARPRSAGEQAMRSLLAR